MKYIIVKIGGSILKDLSDIKKVIKLIKTYPQNLIVINSALFGVTKQIIKLTNSNCLREKISIFNAIKEKHLRILIEFFKPKEIQELPITKLFDQMEFNVIDYTIKERQQNDILLSYGEKLSSYLFESILLKNDFQFNVLEPEKIPLFVYSNSLTLNLEKCRENLIKHIHKGNNFIIPGFYAKNDVGEIITLGLGGTDYTASVVANCLSAKYLDLWKDVSGFKTADPKIIDKTQTIPFLNYDEAAELSYFGAKILHPKTIEPLRVTDCMIRINDFNKFNNTSIKSSTIISKNSEQSNNVIKSCTYTSNVAVLDLHGSNVGCKFGIMAIVTNVLKSNLVNIKSIITSQTRIKIILEKSDIVDAYKLIKTLDLKELEVDIINNITLLAIVGNGIIRQSGVLAKALNALASKQINVEMVSAGASKVSAYFLISKKDEIKALKLIHEEFFEEEINRNGSVASLTKNMEVN